MLLMLVTERRLQRRHAPTRSIGPVAGIGAAPTCRPWWSARLRTPTAAPPCTRAQHRARHRWRRRTEMPALQDAAKAAFSKGLCSGCTAYAAREGCKCRCIGATQQARSSDLNPVVAPHRSASTGSPLAASFFSVRMCTTPRPDHTHAMKRPLQRRHATARSVGPVAGGGAAPESRR